MFYAQAWALTHMLMLGTQNRTRAARRVSGPARLRRPAERGLAAGVRRAEHRAGARHLRPAAGVSRDAVPVHREARQIRGAGHAGAARRSPGGSQRVPDPPAARRRCRSATRQGAESRAEQPSRGPGLRVPRDRAGGTTTSRRRIYAGWRHPDRAGSVRTSAELPMRNSSRAPGRSARPGPPRHRADLFRSGASPRSRKFRMQWPVMADLELRSVAGPTLDTRASIERSRALAPGRDDYAPAARADSWRGCLTSPRGAERARSADVEQGIRRTFAISRAILMAGCVDIESRRLANAGGITGTTTTVPSLRQPASSPT